MSAKRYSEEFKPEAVKQITEGGYAVLDVARRLGITTYSLYAWLKKYSGEAKHAKKSSEERAEVNCLRAELKRVTEERDILKKAARSSTCQRNTLSNDERSS